MSETRTFTVNYRLHVIKIPGDHVMHQQTMRIVEH